jgi:hypothetical protein
MTLTSPLEDLQQYTFQAIAGILRKLEYLASLRDPVNSYSHWGLARVYGELPATKTLGQAHRTSLSEVLSKPLCMLEAELEKSSHDAGVPPAVYLEQLSTRGENLLPAEPGAGSERHLNSVLHALSVLEKRRTAGAIPLAS